MANCSYCQRELGDKAAPGENGAYCSVVCLRLAEPLPATWSVQEFLPGAGSTDYTSEEAENTAWIESQEHDAVAYAVQNERGQVTGFWYGGHYYGLIERDVRVNLP